MKTRRSILLFWALFLVPTLIIAGTAFVLLKNEQERIHLSARYTLSQRAGTIAETIHLTIETVQDNLGVSLMEIEPSSLKQELIQWEATNPLVRNVFVYDPGKPSENRLEYPVRGLASTREEQRFSARYDALFRGRIKFNANQLSSGTQARESNLATIGEDRSKARPGNSYDAVNPLRENQKSKPSSRKKLIELSRQAQQEKIMSREIPATKSEETTEQSYIGRKGWIPWFSENQLFLLGWVQPYKDQRIYGIELELVTLLSRLVTDFPVLPEKGVTMVLMDGNGKVMHQSGQPIDVTGKTPHVRVPVSTLLPHWQVVVFVNEKGFGTGTGFLTISLLLLAIFVIAIVTGGVLLTRLTLSNIKDARQKTSFVASVSHELKTPLTSIRMVAELLASKRVKDPEKVGHYLSVIVSESQRLTRLINNVLDFGRLEQGKKQYHLGPVDVASLLEQIIDAHAIRIAENRLEVIKEIRPDDYTVNTDRDAVEQVVLNLLDNALKYAGGGAFIKFILSRNGQEVRLGICDDGPGIPKEQQTLVFDRFHRVDDSLTANQPGSGLGLSIAKQILNDLGGDLTYEPMPKTGACFMIFLKDKIEKG